MVKHYDMDQVFETIEERLKNDPLPIKDMKAVYQFELSGDTEKTYQLHLHEGTARVEQSALTPANCLIKMKEHDFMDMLMGRLNGISAFMTGKLKVKGRKDLALKLQSVLGRYDL